MANRRVYEDAIVADLEELTLNPSLARKRILKRSKPLLVGAGILLMAACSCTCGSSSPEPSHPATHGLENIPDDEPQAIAEVSELLAGFIHREYPEGKRPAKRDAHAKAHGCVKAEFEVLEVPPDLRVGVFAEAKNFNAWIRYSNGNPTPQADKVGDGRGMAIKLMGVPGKKLLEAEIDEETQDFLMIDYPVFFVDTAKNYLTFTREQQDGNAIKYFIGIRNPESWHLKGAEIARAITKVHVVNPLETRYWSMAPYLLGDKAVKYSAKPCEVHEGLYEKSDSYNFLAENMQKNLEGGEGCFDFMVQLQADAKKMPVENPMVEWSVKESPFVTVARIRIPSQEFRSEEQMTFCENLSYTPWHALPEHRPLGGINRMRRVVYETISKLRHKLNNAPRREPVAGPDFLP